MEEVLTQKLETSLGVKVVPMAASKGAGIADLVDAIKEAALNQQGQKTEKTTSD